jgi:transposase-like protein
VQTATEKLPDFEKDIAFLLSQGYNCSEIARMYECEWKTINRAMQRIAACFEGVDVNGELLK